jgi:hypothetical protein
MIETLDSFVQATGRLGVLERDFEARMVNYSASGCLLETNTRLEVGTVGTLRLVINDHELMDDVQVVRCQPIEGAGASYQIGVRFLWTMTAGNGTLRLALGTGQTTQTDAEPESV